MTPFEMFVRLYLLFSTIVIVPVVVQTFINVRTILGRPPERAPQRGRVVVTREMYPHLKRILHDASYVDFLLSDPVEIPISGSIRLGPGVSIQGFRPGSHDPMTGPDWRIPAP